MNNNIDDAKLMMQFQQEGDLTAFEQLFRRHKDAFVTYLTRLSADMTIAEDVSQRVWLKLIDVARDGRYAPNASFRTYLYTLGRNQYIDEYRRKHEATRTRPLAADDDGPADAGDRPDTSIDANNRSRMLNDAILQLPLEQRDAVSLWANGLSYDQISRITNVPRDTAISRKKYGITKLRAALEAAGLAGDSP